jgi:hypothetical protein
MDAISKLEKILGVKLSTKLYGDLYDANQKNTYSGGTDSITSLRLDDIVITDFSELLPYLKDLRSLTIYNSTLANFSELLQLNYHDLFLNNVVFNTTKCNTIGKLPGHVKFSNMKLDAAGLRCFKLTNSKGFHQVEFKNCHIENIQHLNDIKPISLLIFNKITFTYQPKKTTKKYTRRLSIYNTKLNDLSILPFKNSLMDLEFFNCQISSLVELNNFPDLSDLSFDSDCKIKDKTIIENNQHKKLTCGLEQNKKPLDLRMIRTIKHFVHELNLSNFKQKSIDFIDEFKAIKHLSFRESTLYVNAFLPIANQIEFMSFRNSNIKKTAYFDQFTNLENVEFNNYGEDKKGLKSFKKIIPLKNQLKVLDICDFDKIKEPHYIGEFKMLESLKLGYDVSVKAAKYALTLNNLKKLSLNISSKKRTLNLKNLTELEYLILETNVHFKGFEYLTKLKSLKIEGGDMESTININSLPKMPSLQRLNVTNYKRKIKDLQQFPNLKYLRLKGCPELTLSTLKGLKVLDLENAGITNFSTISTLPRLEKLDLSSAYSGLNLEGIGKFPNLKVLSLMESDIKDISPIESLKKLEYLDLYYTPVTDVQVLNTLPKMKEANLATFSKINLEEQLVKPEIAVYCGLPMIYLRIWEKDEFEI